MNKKMKKKKRNNPNRLMEPLAIIGIGCRFPGGAHSPGAFWELLINNKDAIIDVPSDRWDMHRFYDPDPGKPGKMYIYQGGFLEEKINRFDADFFNISPREGESMDPQQRLLLEVSWEAFEDAGLDVEKLKGSDVGVYIGAFALDYKVLQFDSSNRHLLNSHTAAGCTMSILANRLSHFFDFRGPSITLDTACSSSLAALHYACQALWFGECTIALCGGVNIMFKPEYPIVMCKGQFLSPDARCKTFDISANGYARGEGAGVVILKPLSRAMADCDQVYALVRGTGVNQDGHTAGISFPKREAQETLIKKVYRQARILPSKVQYVEAHGTGTQAGDTTEAAAVGSVFGKGRDSHNKLIVGSVKTNIGHLEAAAGIAGVIKTALCLKHKQIPPNLHFNHPNPAIPFDKVHIRIPQTLEPWPGVDGPALAGVNSFGYGGTNAHAILEEPPKNTRFNETAGEKPGEHTMLLPLSARSKEALTALAERYFNYFSSKNNGNPVLPREICYSAAVRRSHHDHRLAIIAKSMEDLLEKLRQFAGGVQMEGVMCSRVIPAKDYKIVFVFSGMGPQWWYMGRELLKEPVFRKTVEKCEKIFKKLSGWSLLEELTKDETSSRMHEAQVAQPVNFALQLGLTALWRSWGIEPDAVVGHSVGEVAAAYVSGALNLEDAIKVSYHRSRLQQKTAGKGKMLAAALSIKNTQTYLKGFADKISIAAINSPQSVTLSGNGPALEKMAAKLEEKNIFNRFTKVDIAYHSYQMDPLKDELIRSLAAIQPYVPRIPLYSTVTGKKVKRAAWGSTYWWDNIRQRVRFANVIENMSRAGYSTFLEIGPHPVLSAYINETLLNRKVRGNILSSQHRDKPQWETLLIALGQLYLLGYPVQWNKIYPPDTAQYISLPKYPWQREFMFLESEASREDRLGPENHVFLGSRLRSPHLSWEIELNEMFVPYLNDHQVQGNVVFPGAGYVETGLALDRELQGERPTVIESLVFHHPLIVDKSKEPLLHTDFNPGDNIYTVYSSLKYDRSSWTLHASGKILQGVIANEPGPVNIEILRARCCEEIDTDLFYSQLENMGLQYGPAFKIVKRLWRYQGEVLAEIEPLETKKEEGVDYRFHPTILDACFQAVIGALDPIERTADENAVYLPVNIERIKFYRTPGRKLFCYGLIKTKIQKTIKCDILLVEETGKPVAEIKKLCCKLIILSAENQKPKLDKWLYESQWDEIKLRLDKPAPEPNIGTWLICSDNTAIGEKMQELAAWPETRVITVTRGNGSREISPNHIQVCCDSKEDMLHLLDMIEKCRGVVYLWSLSPGESFDSTGAEDAIKKGTENCIWIMHLVQGLIQNKEKLEKSFRLYLVTRGAQAVQPKETIPGLAQSPTWGLGRVIMNEHPELGCQLVDIDPNYPVESIPGIMVHCLTGKIGSGEEVALRNGTFYSHHLVRTPVEEEKIVPIIITPKNCSDSGVKLEFARPGFPETLEFREIKRQKPGAGEVEIEVHSVHVVPTNSKDAKNYRELTENTSPESLTSFQENSPWVECSGIIVRTGTGVTELNPGDEVVAIHRGGSRSFISLPVSDAYVIPRPRKFSPGQAPQLIPFLSAYYALHEIAGLKQDERILVNFAGDGVGLAAIQYAQSTGAMIFAAADSAEKCNYLRALGIRHVMDSQSPEFADEIKHWTDGKGVDVVLNFLQDNAFQKSLSVLAPYGRYIDMAYKNNGKRPIDFNGNGSFRCNFTFNALDINHVLAYRRALVRKLLKDIYSWFEEGIFFPIPTRIFSASELKEALKSTVDPKQTGISVITLKDQEVSAVPFEEKRDLFKDEATYLVTGGLGGFGLETAKWMIKKGACHLALVGRRGATRPEAQEVVASMNGNGLKVKVIQADVSQENQVREMITGIKSTMPPLKGIVHSAMVLDDGLLFHLSKERFEQVLAPKVSGAWNLHRYTQDIALDFFVLYSSVSSLTGNPGQGNYAAANAFLDGLAHYRCSLGLPALTVNWGVLTQVGAAARNPEVLRLLENMGIKGITPNQALETLEFLLSKNMTHVGVVNMNWRKWGKLNPLRVKSSIFSLLAAEVSEKRQDTKEDYIYDKLFSLASKDRSQLVRSLLAEKVAKILSISPDRLDILKSTQNLGIDSLMAADIVASIRFHFEVEYAIMDLLKGPSIVELANDILEKMDLN